jgi:hypothetical protein
VTRLGTIARLLAGLAFLASVSGAARAGFLSPSHYLAFDHPAAGGAVSPFAGMSFRYFHLETFEDGVLNTPGVIGAGGAVVGPGGNTDSVDADDGAINGSGTNGRSYFNVLGGVGVEFAFNAALLGGLPTHVGIVWTDGLGVVTFTAYDANGVSLGTSTASPATPGFNGQTNEDTFFGIVAAGISRIAISNVQPGTPAGIEVDHLQYGAPVPEPSALLLLAAGFLSLGVFALWRKASPRVNKRLDVRSYIASRAGAA